MPKTPISKADLADLIHRRMEDFPECPPDMRIEIRRIKTSEGLGWTAVTGSADNLAHVQCARRVGALTIALRPQYELFDD
ncbi:hypothetical protein V1282_001363 [Nitrobacteraceae bacterium AZCC 2146]